MDNIAPDKYNAALARYRSFGLRLRQILASPNDLVITPEIKALYDFYKNYDMKTWALLTGASGAGKTYLTVLLAKRLIRFEQKSVYYFTSEGMRSELNAMTFEAREMKRQELMNCDLLIIDEIGRSTGTEAYKNHMFEIINYRYDELKPVILISNLSARELFKGGSMFDEAFQRRVESAGMIFYFEKTFLKEAL